MDTALPNPQSYYAGGKAIIYDPATRSFSDGSSLGGSTSPTVLSDSNVRENVIPQVIKDSNYYINTASPAAKTTTPNNSQSFDPNEGYKKILSDAGLTGTDSPSIESSLTNDPYLLSTKSNLDNLLAATDAETSSYIKSIQDQYKVKENQLQETQRSQNGQLTQSLLLGNSMTGAPVSSSGIMAARTNYDIQSLNDLQNEENNLIQKAKTAQMTGKYKALQEYTDLIEKKRIEKQTLAKDINDRMIADNKKLREKQVQSSREGAISSLVAQGVTDTKKLLDYLNKYQDGTSTGGNFTAEEVSKALKNISTNYADSDITKLSGNIKDFYILQKNGSLPTSISSLPQQDQLKSFLTYIKPKTGGGVGGNKLTLSEVRSQGLPLSLVGMSEYEIAQNFEDATPPQWFVEKMQKESLSSLLPDVVQSGWDKYRQAYTSSRSSTVDKQQANVVEKAKDYFNEVYQGSIDDDSAQTLAEQVKIYVDGGMSYQDAVEKVVEDSK